MEEVFVYGSLKQGNTTRGMQHFPNSEFVGVARTKRAIFKMVDLGSFPGVMIIENDGTEYIEQGYQIEGEVYKVSQEDLEQLDAIEGVPHFYDRVRVSTTRGNPFMYILPNDGEYDTAPTHEDRREVVFADDTGRTEEIGIPASPFIGVTPVSGDRSGGILTWLK